MCELALDVIFFQHGDIAVRKVKYPIDWHQEGDIKAQIQLFVKKILLCKGVHAERQEILAEIMEQAEARYKDWEFEAA